jgi:hypothetical protein
VQGNYFFGENKPTFFLADQHVCFLLRYRAPQSAHQLPTLLQQPAIWAFHRYNWKITCHAIAGQEFSSTPSK